MASERERAQTSLACQRRVVGAAKYEHKEKLKPLERGAIAGDSPVGVRFMRVSGYLSSAGPEESCVNLPAPSGKAKYSSDTDSEPVP